MLSFADFLRVLDYGFFSKWNEFVNVKSVIRWDKLIVVYCLSMPMVLHLILRKCLNGEFLCRDSQETDSAFVYGNFVVGNKTLEHELQ
ncbi:hypothetical protein HZH68_014187 [Vespula germanica]|uniref:Uncharacterized protein n=1 Tax=Vespula germanica TaxID=30212 RepID=A0A834MU48_VESGE|nr:hypothetical protein HZH68_014187 [Vespula germanica]